MTSWSIIKLRKYFDYAQKVTLYIFYFIFYSLSTQGEACIDKIYVGKTPRSVSLCGVQRRAVLVCAESDYVQCYPILDIRQFNFLTLRSDSLRGVTYFATISVKTNV